MTRAREKAFRQAASRHGRRKTGLSICEGRRCCAELMLRSPQTIEAVLVAETCADPEIRARCDSLSGLVETVPQNTISNLATTENPQGILVLVRIPELHPLENPPADPFLLVLDGLADPGNLGTILRTAWAAGLSQACLTNGTVDPYAPKTLRAGMGAQFALELHQLHSLADIAAKLKQWRWETLWLTVPRGGVDAFSADFTLPRSALVIGGEARGISDPTAGRTVSLPMPGDAESLNAAQAATVFLFEAVRRQILH
ncbi:MAG: TrmH family RNA methyltransferase [Verrucomicrobiota bacterium]